MDIALIRSEMDKAAAEIGCFVTDITLTKDNDVTIAIESEEGTVDMDDCVAINDKFLAVFDRDVEDYSLTVTSAGLDQPFKILKQYIKAIGTEVVVKLKDGRKIVGTLAAASGDGYTLRYETKEIPEGKKKKELVSHEDTFTFAGTNSVTPHIVFE